MATGGWVYAPGMTREPPPASPSRGPERGLHEHAQPGKSRPRESPAEESQPGERYGPIVITRHVKEDGRALLLYTRSAREPA